MILPIKHQKKQMNRNHPQVTHLTNERRLYHQSPMKQKNSPTRETAIGSFGYTGIDWI
jgi:hypothetical protein